MKALDIAGGAWGSACVTLLAALHLIPGAWAFAGIVGLSGGVAVLQKFGFRGFGTAGGVAMFAFALLKLAPTPESIPDTPAAFLSALAALIVARG